MSASTLYGSASAEGGPRERVLRTAYDLFCLQGIRAVGIDTVIDAAGVAKMSLYRHFGSKDELALAVLERREERWSVGWLQRGATQRVTAPAGRLLACFDLFSEWFDSDPYEGCLFLNSLLEARDGPIADAAIERLAHVRSFLRSLAEQAGVSNPDSFASQWQLLMWGAIIGAWYEKSGAAARARDVAVLMLEREGIAPG